MKQIVLEKRLTNGGGVVHVRMMCTSNTWKIDRIPWLNCSILILSTKSRKDESEKPISLPDHKN